MLQSCGAACVIRLCLVCLAGLFLPTFRIIGWCAAAWRGGSLTMRSSKFAPRVLVLSGEAFEASLAGSCFSFVVVVLSYTDRFPCTPRGSDDGWVWEGAALTTASFQPKHGWEW